MLGCEDWRIQETDRGWIFFLRYPDLDTVEKARRKRLERQEAVRLSTDPDQARERILAYLAQNALTETALRRLGADLCRGLAGLRESGVAQYNLTMEDLLTRPGGGFCLGGCGLLDPAQDTGLLAPEVALGEEPGDTAQVYALGMVLYRLLNDGRGPFLPGPLEPVTAEAEAEAQLQSQRDQTYRDERNALDNSALYAETRGDRGGIGKAQYNAIQAAALANRQAVNQAQIQLAASTNSQIADLRAQGEFEKADALLQIAQTYLEKLLDMEKWAAEFGLDQQKFQASVQQWQMEFAQKAGAALR